MMVVGAIIALIIIVVLSAVFWVCDLYTGIFTIRGRARWRSWNVIQRILFLLGLPILLIAIPITVGWYALVIISILYLGLSVARAISRAISE